MKNKIVAVCGPTASGKTGLSIALAKKLCGEVVSNDSMQIYKGMEIGTAAPTNEEMDGVVHHMVGAFEPTTDFSCADYAAFARPIVEDIHRRGKIPVFCGGTGLYLDSVLQVESFSEGVKDTSKRDELALFAAEHGEDALHARLAAVDPEAAEAIHKNNVRRVIRAIEIFETTGMTKTQWDRQSLHIECPYDAKIIVLEFSDRQVLYDRINRRVDIMFDLGLEQEVRTLWESGALKENLPAFQAIGYKEFIPYFKGEISLFDVSEQIKMNTRRYSKRQVTWFKRYKDAVRIGVDNEDGSIRTLDSITNEALSRLWKGESCN